MADREKQISYLEDRVVEIIQTEQEKGKVFFFFFFFEEGILRNF